MTGALIAIGMLCMERLGEVQSKFLLHALLQAPWKLSYPQPASGTIVNLLSSVAEGGVWNLVKDDFTQVFSDLNAIQEKLLSLLFPF